MGLTERSFLERMELNGFTGSKIVTNYDHLISKTPEELAEWIAYDASCETCPVKTATDYECQKTDCKTAWGLWLKSPVEKEVDE